VRAREGHDRVVVLAGGSRVLELSACDADACRVGAGGQRCGGQGRGERGGEQGAPGPAGNKELAMTATREKTFLLARPEARVLDWLARRLPRFVMPDHLTLLGVVAAIGIAAAYALSNRDPAWLWAASGLLVVHWLGDSLDGTLARVRRSERPRYGYYLDHLVDAIATALIGIGLGLSPYLLLATGLAIVLAYLVLSINTYLETNVLGVFTLGYGRLGPTEARLGLIAANTALALGVVPTGSLFGVLDVVGLAVAVLMVVALTGRAARNLRRLARLEPARHAAP
jgi:archaetidylinositol phosphate synthase